MTPAPPPGTGEVRAAHRLDLGRLSRHLSAAIGGLGAITAVRQFRGGQSNPTYWLTDGARQLVLRKKPPGKLLPSAHAVEREARVMAALAETPVPVPEVLHVCEDPSVIGTPFFVMAFVPGRNLRDPRLPGLAPDERRAIYEEEVRVLAAIHAVDLAATGLADYGRPAGYMARQVRRWSRQYEASRTGDVPAMEALIAWLPDHIPASDETTLTHGDYRLDNLLFAAEAPRAVAVVDWELSTLGHPLADLAYLCLIYDVNLPPLGGLAGADIDALGIPPEAELVARYEALSGRAAGPDWPIFRAFALFRLAAIAQGVYKRGLQGNAASADATRFADAVRILAETACRHVGITR